MSSNSLHGISMVGDKTLIPLFDGTDLSMVQPFKLALAGYLTGKGIPMPKS